MHIVLSTWTLLWLVLLWVNVWCIFEFVGLRYMVNMFPEGRRWWMLPVQWLTLIAFAALIHFQPF